MVTNHHDPEKPENIKSKPPARPNGRPEQNLASTVRSLQEYLSAPALCPVDASVNVLALLADSAALLKAQTTKLSLLILNCPFSPQEVTFILQALHESVLPTLHTAVASCLPETYSRCLSETVRNKVNLVSSQLQQLLAHLPIVKVPKESDTLSWTRSIWKECDELVDLAEKGTVGYANARYSDFLDLFDDAIREIAESYEDKLVVKRLKQLRLLLVSLQKRRLSTCPPLNRHTSLQSYPTEDQILSLDKLPILARQVSEETDEIAGILDQDDFPAASERLDQLFDLALKSREDFALDWDQREDHFSTWSAQWCALVRPSLRSD